jgi:L-ascorbate metabolism protein UlaG (beta-lactamase superfamily)
MRRVATRTPDSLPFWLPALVVLTLLAPFIVFIALLNDRPSLEPIERYRVTAEPVEPGDVSVQWLGAGGLVIRDGETAFMVDGFFSRPGLARLFFSKIQPQEDRIRQGIQAADIARLDAVITTGSRFDQAMDAPFLARHFHAPLIGSPSTANIARGAGLPEALIRTVKPESSIRLGDFRLHFLPARAMPMPPLIEQLLGAGESIEQPLVPPARVGAWKSGTAMTLHIQHPDGSILIKSDAGFQAGQLAGLHADLALLSVAGLNDRSPAYQRQYVKHVIRAARSRHIVVYNWDDIFQPVSRDVPPRPRLLDDFPETFTRLLRADRPPGQELAWTRPLKPFGLHPSLHPVPIDTGQSRE